MIDDLFILIINKNEKISSEFLELIEQIEFNYEERILKMLSKENLQMIKEIIYVLYELKKDKLQNILSKVKRQDLIDLYKTCKTFETDNFLEYYKKSIINKYST